MNAQKWGEVIEWHDKMVEKLAEAAARRIDRKAMERPVLYDADGLVIEDIDARRLPA